MSFTVTILGSGSAIPTAGRNPTSQYIVCNGRHFLMDCGEATQIQMRRFGVKFQKINHIFISHLHGDHYFGLVGLLSTMHLLGRDKNLHIYAPKGLKKVVELQFEVGGGILDFDITWHELERDHTGIVYEDKKTEVYTFPMNHRIPVQGYLFREKEKERTLIRSEFEAAGLKLEHAPLLKKGIDVTDDSGKVHRATDYTRYNPNYSYAFCSDTAYSKTVVEAVRGVDVLYHEATFLEELRHRAKATFHSTAGDAARVAKEAGVKKLVLGHLSARYTDPEAHLAEASVVFPNVILPEDGFQLRIGR